MHFKHSFFLFLTKPSCHSHILAKIVSKNIEKNIILPSFSQILSSVFRPLTTYVLGLQDGDSDFVSIS